MELPLFPLHVVLFPGRPLPLHLFEPRYRLLLRDCLAADRRFGVVAIRAGREVGGCAEIFEVGTIARIEDVKALPDGRADIVTRGVERFRVLDLLPGTPYLNARVELMPDPPAGEDVQDRSVRLRALLAPYLESLGAPAELLAHLPTDPDKLAYLAASAMQVELPEQQRLLELPSARERVDATLQMLRREAGLIRRFGQVGSLRPVGPHGCDLN